ncbi:hypothetical protein SBV1_3310008 [Verrucomicrobia bacterium]|nr:hypothetical protein SBV1_3310008 [Verrucomicrobiota bacterium]
MCASQSPAVDYGDPEPDQTNADCKGPAGDAVTAIRKLIHTQRRPVGNPYSCQLIFLPHFPPHDFVPQ